MHGIPPGPFSSSLLDGERAAVGRREREHAEVSEQGNGQGLLAMHVQRVLKQAGLPSISSVPARLGPVGTSAASASSAFCSFNDSSLDELTRRPAQVTCKCGADRKFVNW